MKVRNHNYYVKMTDGSTRVFRTYSTADYFCKMNKNNVAELNCVVLKQRAGAGNQYSE